MDKKRILMLTSEWPTLDRPYAVPFIVRQVEFVRLAGWEVDVYHFRGAKNPFNYLHAWKQVHKRLKNGNYDLVHAQWGQSALLTLPKTKPLVVTFRGDDVNGIVGNKKQQTFLGRILQIVTRYIAKVADECVFVSRGLAERLTVDDYHIIPSGIDLNLFSIMERDNARHSLGLVLDKSIVLFVGDGNNPRKRLDLIQNAVKLAQFGGTIDFEFVYVGNIVHEQIPVYMNACDVLVLASVHEGSPNVVKEALACNLPVVSTDVGDVRERIGSVEGCVVCDDDRPETLAAGILSVLSRNKRIDGRKTVLDLDETILTQKLISVYKKAIEGK
ncbi:MAG: glycosyltransferase [Anaerolineales bacterium]|nr:glycosyltransferase [Anaerolineales bacterium]